MAGPGGGPCGVARRGGGDPARVPRGRWEDWACLPSGSGCRDLPRALGPGSSRLQSFSGRGVARRRVPGARKAGGAGPGGSSHSE